MSDSLEGPKLKIERANTHLIDLIKRNDAFFNGPDGHPYIITREVYNKDPTQECFKVKIIKCQSEEFPIIVGDVIHNLRSALDHLICALALLNGATNTRSLYFPVGRNKAHFEHPRTQKKIKGLSQDAVEMIHALKPYKGGNDLLWALHECSIIDKHNSLISIAVNRPTAIAGGGEIRMTGIAEGYHYISIPAWNSFDKEMVVLTFPKGAQFDGDGNLGVIFCIAFREIDAIKGQAVIEVLKQFVDLTKRIVGIFEERFF